jgi:hypothetical protein
MSSFSIPPLFLSLTPTLFLGVVPLVCALNVHFFDVSRFAIIPSAMTIHRTGTSPQSLVLFPSFYFGIHMAM